MATRAELDMLITEKASDVLTGEQKNNLVTNLLQEMRWGNKIQTVGSKRGRYAKWAIYNEDQKDSV
jgi:hypothetical protein